MNFSYVFWLNMLLQENMLLIFSFRKNMLKTCAMIFGKTCAKEITWLLLDLHVFLKNMLIFFDAEIISQTFELLLKQILRNFKTHCKYCFKKVCGQKNRRNMRHQRIQHCSNTLWLIECLKWNLILCKNIYMLQKVVYKYSENFRLLQIDYFYT